MLLPEAYHLGDKLMFLHTNYLNYLIFPEQSKRNINVPGVHEQWSLISEKNKTHYL